MKLRIRFLVAALLLFSNAALAETIDLDKVPEVAVSADNNSLYLKGYVGMAIADLDKLKLPNTTDFSSSYHWKNNNDLDNAFLAGLGIGFQRNSYLRFDGTVEYRAKNTVNRSLNGFDQHKYKGDISSTVIMGNAYLDLMTFRNITPYVGVGVGAAAHHVSDFTVKSSGQYNNVSSNTDWNVAWALHTGVGIRLTKKLTLDVGYSYSDLGDARTGRGENIDHIKFDHLTSHDIKLGLRYTFH